MIAALPQPILVMMNVVDKKITCHTQSNDLALLLRTIGLLLPWAVIPKVCSADH